jgi:hypothetical protein
MADPLSITLAAVPLVALFNNAVDFFEYVQLGREFRSDFTTSLVRLEAAQLQLSRWGEGVGIGRDLDGATSLEKLALDAESVKKAERHLKHVQKLFADAIETADEYRDEAEPDSTALVPLDRNELDAGAKSLSRKMSKFSLKRRGKVGVVQKMKWVLYEQKHYRRLIEDISDLVEKLVLLFPAAKPAQQELCKTEVEELKTDNGLLLLKEAALDKDAFLKEAIESALEQAGHTSYTATFSGSYNSGVQIGQNIGSIDTLQHRSQDERRGRNER